MPPSPRSPPTADVLEDIRDAMASMQAAIEALAENQARIANYQRYMAESYFGATPDTAGMWDGTNRYPETP